MDGSGAAETARDGSQGGTTPDCDVALDFAGYATAFGCPLHFAMSQLAQAAVKQHVLYAEGERVARPELIQDLELWSRLHGLIQMRVCGASRTADIDPHRLELDLDAIYAAAPTSISAGVRAWLREMLARCAACTPSDACPLDREPVAPLLGQRGS